MPPILDSAPCTPPRPIDNSDNFSMGRHEGEAVDDLFYSPPKKPKPSEGAPAQAAKQKRQRPPKAPKEALAAPGERPPPAELRVSVTLRIR